MKFILPLFILLVSIEFILSLSSSSSNDWSYTSSDASSNAFNWLKTEMYTNSETCEGDLLSAAYLKTGFCGFEGISKVVCLDDGTVENIIYTEQGCTGDIKERIKIEPNNCTNSEKYICTESIEIPSNTFQVWFTHSTCENDNWKEDVWQMEYILLNSCLYANTGANTIHCNSTIAYENIYNTTNSCNASEQTGYKFLTLPECGKKSHMFSICDN
ncbi:hypothetical protein RB653_000343 [Dictyostelium firmibasis]|uniref:Uncharacterized protein n=1 Tax=Dictyostelium firmibasis TaxID=79012 RepID=A0AAN7YXT8_9MYCE